MKISNVDRRKFGEIALSATVVVIAAMVGGDSYSTIHKASGRTAKAKRAKKERRLRQEEALIPNCLTEGSFGNHASDIAKQPNEPQALT